MYEAKRGLRRQVEPRGPGVVAALAWTGSGPRLARRPRALGGAPQLGRGNWRGSKPRKRGELSGPGARAPRSVPAAPHAVARYLAGLASNRSLYPCMKYKEFVPSSIYFAGV